MARATGVFQPPRPPRSARPSASPESDREVQCVDSGSEAALTNGVAGAYRRCRELGMRLSRQRRMVLDLLWTEKNHLSARDIFEQLNRMGRNIGHTSVYQNLEALQSAG